MNRLAGPAPPGQPAAGAGRGMGTGTGIFLITAGAILRFALGAGSPHGLNVHVVGVSRITRCPETLWCAARLPSASAQRSGQADSRTRGAGVARVSGRWNLAAP
ncbi:MAG TPA: hypothetical protein VGJ54_12485 [Streptosporangiaceae bacterium]